MRSQNVLNKELLNFLDMHSQYVGVCNELRSKNLVNNKKKYTSKKFVKKINFLTIIKKIVLPMLTFVG